MIDLCMNMDKSYLTINNKVFALRLFLPWINEYTAMDQVRLRDRALSVDHNR